MSDHDQMPASSQNSDAQDEINLAEFPPPETETKSHDELQHSLTAQVSVVQSMETLAEILRAEIADNTNLIMNAFEKRFQHDQYKERQIGQLHEELEAYKNDLLRKMMRPLLGGVVRLHDNLTHSMKALREQSEAQTIESLFDILESFTQEVEMLLENNEITTFQESGEKFDPRRQTAVRRVMAPSEAHVGTIAGRVYVGFEQADKIIMRERVAVYVEKEPLQN